MRSSNGPEMRFWYLVMTAGAQVQALMGSFAHPQGQGCTQLSIYSLENLVIAIKFLIKHDRRL